MNQLTTIIDHPLVRHHLTRLRDRNLPPEMFRAQIRRLTNLLAYEATKDLAEKPTDVQTPLEKMTGSQISVRVGLIPILRAGLGMVDAVMDLIPSAEVWHLGFYRDEETFKPVAYYTKLPTARPVDVALIVDPMLATGGSAIAALTSVKNWGVRDVRLLSILAAPEGIGTVSAALPDVRIFVCGVDRELNSSAYILPGLGDAGNRIFNSDTT